MSASGWIIDGAAGITHPLEVVLVGLSMAVAMTTVLPVLWRWLFAPHVERLIRHTLEPTRQVAAEARDELREVHGTLTRNGYTNDPPTLLDLVHDIQVQASVNQRLLMEHLEEADRTVDLVLPALEAAGVDLPPELTERAHRQ